MIGTKDAVAILGIKERRIRVLCEEGRIPGAVKVGGTWTLPDSPVVKPAGRARPSKVKMEASMKKQRGQAVVQYGVLMASVVLSAYLAKPLIGAMIEEAFKPSIKMLERANHANNN